MATSCPTHVPNGLVQWTLIGPEEMLLAQGKAGIHTSCRSESSN